MVFIVISHMHGRNLLSQTLTDEHYDSLNSTILHIVLWHEVHENAEKELLYSYVDII